jgi:riboflavin-specific deaminase-like protein
LTYQAEVHNSAHSGQPPGSADASHGAEQRAWTLAYAAARAIGSFDVEHSVRFRLDEDGRLQPLAPELSGGDLLWKPRHGWQSLGTQDSAAGLLELYLPISSATARQPITVAHLGQSLDGFIATPSGESTFVTGPENILHLHRLRALCDAVVVGAGTVSSDNPRLTTRLVTGTNPVRIVLDPACRLSSDFTIFSDQQAHTLRVCAAGRAVAAYGAADEELLEVSADGTRLNLPELMQILRARGYHRILVEGGGVTVSSFLEAGLVDRLHIAIAPVLIGEGRPAVRLPPRARLQDCLRLRHRVHRSGEDILFDCDLRAPSDPPP